MAGTFHPRIVAVPTPSGITITSHIPGDRPAQVTLTPSQACALRDQIDAASAAIEQRSTAGAA